MEAPFADPLFTKVRAEDGENWTYVCLYRENCVDAGPPCGRNCDDFSQLIAHVESYHGIALNCPQDLCFTNEYVFPSKIFAVEHWLVHAIDLASEDPLLFQFNDTFEKLNNIQADIVENIIYSDSDNSPPIENGENDV